PRRTRLQRRQPADRAHGDARASPLHGAPHARGGREPASRDGVALLCPGPPRARGGVPRAVTRVRETGDSHPDGPRARGIPGSRRRATPGRRARGLVKQEGPPSRVRRGKMRAVPRPPRDKKPGARRSRKSSRSRKPKPAPARAEALEEVSRAPSTPPPDEDP